MSNLQPTRFDYSVVDDDTRRKLISLAGDISRQKKIGLQAMMEMGKEIATAQSLLSNYGNGVFGEWIETECGIGRTTAHRYLKAWESFQSVPALEQYTAEAMYLLAAPSTPEAAFKKALKSAENGIKVTETVAKQIIKAVQPPREDTPRNQTGKSGSVEESKEKTNGKISGGVTFNPSELESDRDPAPKKDEWDAPIQKHAAKAFETVPRFNEIIKKLREAARLYADLCKLDGGQFLQTCSLDTTGGFKHSGITNAIRDLQASRPAHTLCPYSFNENFTHSKECLLCHGLNWVPAIKGDRVPERLVKLAKKSACSR